MYLRSVQRTLKALYVIDSAWKNMYVRGNKFETDKSFMNSKKVFRIINIYYFAHLNIIF